MGAVAAAPVEHDELHELHEVQCESASESVHPHRFRHIQVNEDNTRENLVRLWEEYVPKETQTSIVARPLVREMLLRAVRDFNPSPSEQSDAEDLIVEALHSVPFALAVEDAFNILCSVVSDLHRTRERGLRGTRASSGLGHASRAMPRGCRMIDVKPCSESILNKNGSTTSMPSALSEVPQELTRAQLESVNAKLCATLAASQAAYEKLVHKGECLRLKLSNHQGAGNNYHKSNADMSLPASDFANIHHGFHLQHRLKSLEAKHDQYLSRIRSSSVMYKNYACEIEMLREECNTKLKAKKAARKQRDEAWEELQAERRESTTLNRKVKTEQLHVQMLRTAFEEEEARTGTTLKQAEAPISDLIASTEGTQQMEAMEHRRACESMKALNEIHACQAQDGLAAKTQFAQLHKELEAAKMELEETRLTVGMSEDNSTLGSEHSEASMKLATLRKEYDGLASIVYQRTKNVSIYHRELEVLRTTSEKLADNLIREQQLLYDQILISQQESKLDCGASATDAVNPVLFDLRQHGIAFINLADGHASNIREELELVRAKLSEPSIPTAMNAQAAGSMYDGLLKGPASDLEAAGLQRKVSVALAGERENRCHFMEETLQDRLNQEVNQALQAQLAHAEDRRGRVQSWGHPEPAHLISSTPRSIMPHNIRHSMR